MRFGLFGDLHIGVKGGIQGTNHWCFDRAFDIAQLAVGLLNQRQLDFIIAEGDLTNDGTPAQLEQVNGLLSQLTMPCYAVPGNHDREAVMDSSFDQFLAAHIPPIYQIVDGIAMLFLREQLPAAERGFQLDWDGLEAALDAIRSDKPRLILLFSHVPVLLDEAYAQQHDIPLTERFADGAALLERLESAGHCPIAAFCGHLHMHRVHQQGQVMQCVTGAQIEYPMECRIVEIDQETLTMTIFPTAARDDAARSFAGAEWVRGEIHDRDYVWQIDS